MFLSFKGFENYTQYEKVREKQLNINDQVNTYKATWIALQPTIKVWKESFTPASSILDMVTLYESMNVTGSGLVPSTDVIIDGGRRDFGNKIGLTSSCVLNSGGGFAFKPTSIDGYIKGIKYLEDRHDIVFGNVIIDASSVKDSGKPTMILSNICALLRADEEF
jgi:hypothetical protein